jgi:hypothetical protein
LKIILTQISGDADLYVSNKVSKPTTTNSTWRSYEYGSDVVEINPQTDNNACTKPCTYFVAVVGSTDGAGNIPQYSQFALYGIKGA